MVSGSPSDPVFAAVRGFFRAAHVHYSVSAGGMQGRARIFFPRAAPDAKKILDKYGGAFYNDIVVSGSREQI
jgi:hypothetical protein